MADPNLTKSENIEVKAREIDFVTRFARNWEHLREILGILRPIKISLTARRLSLKHPMRK